jgi:hypothetical protein
VGEGGGDTWAWAHAFRIVQPHLVEKAAEVAINKANVFAAKELGHEGAAQLQDLRSYPQGSEQQLVLDEF